jgi:acyl-CoA synthetase (AMP-forming)/AMP-acid ligase II
VLHDDYLEPGFLNRSTFCYRCFGGEILEGYGMTETSCVITTMDVGDKLIGHVGSPNPACGKLHFAGMESDMLG